MTDDNAEFREPVELLVPPVEQGSTFIPPADEEAVQRDASDLFDDDDLATAMAEQFARATGGPSAAVSTATAVITVVDSTGAITVVSDAVSAEPGPDSQPETPPVPATPPAPETPPVQPTPPAPETPPQPDTTPKPESPPEFEPFPGPVPGFEPHADPAPEFNPTPGFESAATEPEAPVSTVSEEPEPVSAGSEPVVVPPPLVEPPLSQFAPLPPLRPFEHTPRVFDTSVGSGANGDPAADSGPTDESVVGARLGFAALFDPPVDPVDSDDTAEVATQAHPTASPQSASSLAATAIQPTVPPAQSTAAAWEPSRTPTMNFDAVIAGGNSAPPPSDGPSPTWVEGSIVVAAAGESAATRSAPTQAVAAHPADADRAQTLEDLFGFNPDTVPVTAIPSARDIHQFPADLAPAIQAPVIATTPPAAFPPEASNAEATPLDRRVGRSTRMFWLWFAANSSLVSVLLGGAVFSLGMSLRQSLIAVMAGIAVSFLPLGLGTLSGKRSGQPTLIASRAVFGVVGNGLPAFFGLVSRLFWGAALLWLLGIGTASILTSAGYTAGFSEAQLTLLTMGVAFVLALLVAFFGYGLLAPLQLVLSIVTGVLVVGFIALTLNSIDIATALTVPDGEWILVVTGAVLVFSFVGLAWANATADLARYQRPSSMSGGSSSWATFGVVLPSFALIAHGALLAASDPGVATGFRTAPMDTLGALLPAWYPIPLIAATALSLLSGVIVSLYSGGFALRALGFRMPRPLSSVIAAVFLAALAALFVFSVTDFDALVRDFATTLAVPIAAWVGIFIVDTMIRHKQLDAASLVRRGGIYADVRWVNSVMFVLVTVVGLGLTTAAVDWLAWEGFLFAALGVPLDSALAASDIGVLIALVLGMLTPVIAGIPAIRRQESTAPRAE